MEEKEINTLSWTAPEYSHVPRNADWFWTIGLAALVGIVIAIWFKNYLFALFLIIGSFSLILVGVRHPREVEFSITKEGLTAAGILYTSKKLKGFKIKDAKSPYAKLILETDRYFMPVFTLPIPEANKKEIWDTLIQITIEKDIEEPHSIQFMEKIGF